MSADVCDSEGCVCRPGHEGYHVRYYEEEGADGWVGTFWEQRPDGDEAELKRMRLSGSIVDDPLAVASIWDRLEAR